MAKLLWTNRANFGPAPRTSHTMAFDSVRNRAVLFGGFAQSADLALTPLGDTWEWDGSFWTQVEDTGPSARSAASMVYDSARKVSLLFGGMDAQAPLGDTWKWDGDGWTMLAETGPSGRSITAMAFDSKRGRTVLFGGQTVDSFFLGDTWEFDGAEWTQVQDAGPPARSAHAMAFDTASNRAILFGGASADGRLGDTWAWDGNEWVQISEFGPPVRSGMGMVSAGANDLILFGGLKAATEDQPLEFFGDTWEFDGKLWTQRQDIGPGPLLNPAMVYDSGRGRVVLFGGTAPGQPDLVSGLTWETAVAPAVVG